MPVQCCVKSCKKLKVAEDGVPYYRLPWNNHQLCQKWLARAGIDAETLAKSRNCRHWRMCGRHFAVQRDHGADSEDIPTINIPDFTEKEAASSLLDLHQTVTTEPHSQALILPLSQTDPSIRHSSSSTSTEPINAEKILKRKLFSTSSSQVTPTSKRFRSTSVQRTPPTQRSTQVTPKRKTSSKSNTDLKITTAAQTDMPSCLFIQKHDVSCQTDRKTTSNKTVQASLSKVEEIKSSNKELKKMTGIEDYNMFMILHKYLTSFCAVNDCNIDDCSQYIDPSLIFSHIKTEDQLILVLYKLKRNPIDSVLSSEFKISTGRISEMLKFWICRMYRKFKIIKLWPSDEKIERHMPLSTKQNFPDLAAISDCVEFSTQVPRGPVAGKQLFSHYKNCHTVKAMYTTAPNGALIHCSDFYGGNASDKEIFGQSDLANRLKPGQGLMVDKGFLIKDLIQGKDIKLYRPPFLSEKSRQFQPENRDSGRLIARSRIIVENFNARLSTFAFLKQKKIPVLSLPFMNEIGFVCGFLANLGTLIRQPRIPDSEEQEVAAEMDISYQINDLETEGSI